VQVLQGAARLDQHGCRLIPRERQHRPGTGDLPDQIAGLVVRHGARQGVLGGAELFLHAGRLADDQQQRAMPPP